MKLRGMDLKRFQLKYPKKQIITKEQLAMYLTTIACKPHIVSKGKNWVMKEFGTQIGSDYKANRACFNELYFRKCVCAAILFRTVDGYLEENKDSARHPTGFWYKAGGYKLNIVPYSIAKILSCIPAGYSLNWNQIWQAQALSPSFIREIEIVTKKTNDFICDSHGIIVTEYCKRESTWIEYRDQVKHVLSPAFVEELIPISLLNEEEKAAKKDEGETQKLDFQVEIVRIGHEKWQELLAEGKKRGLLSFQDQSLLSSAIKACLTGSLPTILQAKRIMAVKDKLETEGIK